MPSLDQKQKSINHLVETLYYGCHYMNTHTSADNKFLWISLGVIYHASNTGELAIPTDEEVLSEIAREAALNRDFLVDEEKIKKMLKFYHAVISLRSELLSNVPENLANPPRFIEMQVAVTNIKNLAKNYAKHIQFIINLPKESTHYKLIEKLKTRVNLLMIFRFIYELTGYFSNINKEINEINSYIYALEEGGKKGSPVETITRDWKAQNPRRLILQSNNNSWFYKPDSSYEAVVPQEREFLHLHPRRVGA